MCRRTAFFLAVIVLGFIGCAFAWEIADFQVDIVINKDSSFVVTENILADFSDIPKHGIKRNIPIEYLDERGKRYDFGIKVLSILDEDGVPWKYEEYHSGANKVLKIGSRNRTYQEKKLFAIKYKVTGAILYLENHDELYWNAVGTEWDARIKKIKVNVRLPALVEKEYLLVQAYSGRQGSGSSDVGAQVIDKENISFTATSYLPYEGLTIVVGWPKGIVEAAARESKFKAQSAAPSAKEDLDSAARYALGRRRYWLWGLGINLVLPCIVFFIMLDKWRRYGKDPQLHKSIVVEYKPPEEIIPLEMGALIDDKVDMRDISATIVDLAVRGYLKIVQTKGVFFHNEYSFLKLKEFYNDETLRPFEKTILSGLFGSVQLGHSVSMGELENKYYKIIPVIKEHLFKRLISCGYYSKDPEKTTSHYIGIGILMFFIAFFAFFLSFGLAFVLSGLIILAFARFMPAKTNKGALLLGKILGFEEFLMRTEKDKMRLLEQGRDIFERMLPYAICLGISNQWAKVFSGLYSQPPDWFSGDYSGGFSMDYFILNLNRTLSTMNSTFSSMPRTVSSGGGFSGGSCGGGFGGGGGSSW